ncbi:hypothetical protein [Paenibacillus sp. FSL R5-0470]|uniref:hypothetical protein n=1 Tax=Paenibacillus sp. FSL R5-0470 TaxID=2921641 RepID=UPI0030DDA5B9
MGIFWYRAPKSKLSNATLCATVWRRMKVTGISEVFNCILYSYKWMGDLEGSVTDKSIQPPVHNIRATILQ